MEWRAILAVALSIFVLILWQYVFVPVSDPPHSPVTPESQEKPAPEDQSPLPRSQDLARRLVRARATALWDQTAPPLSLNERIQVANFTSSVAQLTVTAEQPRGTVRFEYQTLPAGVW